MSSSETVAAAFTDAGLDDLYAELQHYARHAIIMHAESAADAEAQQVGTSRLGGNPDLPTGLPWPTNPDTGAPLSFVAQLNCAELHPFDVDQQLPEQGMLYFFYDLEAFTWGFDPKDGAGSHVHFCDGPADQLQTTPAPQGAQRFDAHTVQFSSRLEIPEYTSQLVQASLSDEDYDQYLDLIEELDLIVENKVLGHSNNIQNGMELQCELVRNGIYCGSSAAYQDPRVEELAPGRFTWQLLLQVASQEDTDMQWGDEGTLYFWIRSEDLAARRFDQAWQILQSY